MEHIDLLTNYHDGLAVSDEYEIKRIVATTYSLEPEFVYLLMTLTEPVSDFAFWDTLALKKCLVDKKRLTVFYQEDKFYGKGVIIDPAFAELVDTCCVPVKKGNYAFHPKVILAEYGSLKDGRIVFYRLMVSSRNLTGSDSVETGVVLKCDHKPEKVFESTDLKSVIDFINSQDWYCNEKKAEVFFQGEGTASSDSSYQRIGLGKDNNKIIISPFFTNELCKKIANAEFWKVENVHSKMYFVEGVQGESNYLWLGSANCTQNGLHNNYECIAGIPTEISEDKFREMFLAEGENIYDPSEEMTKKSDKESLLESVTRNCKFILKLSENGSLFECRIEFSKEGLPKEGLSLEEVEICIVNGNGYKKLSEDEIFWKLGKRKISRNLMIRLVGSRISRMIRIELDDESKEIFEQIDKENRNRNISELNDPFPAFFNASYDDEEEAEYEEYEIDTEESAPHNQNAGVSISNNDGMYEKLVKVYAMGDEGQRLLRRIRDIVEKSENESDRKMVNLFPIRGGE